MLDHLRHVCSKQSSLQLGMGSGRLRELTDLFAAGLNYNHRLVERIEPLPERYWNFLAILQPISPIDLLHALLVRGIKDISGQSKYELGTISARKVPSDELELKLRLLVFELRFMDEIFSVPLEYDFLLTIEQQPYFTRVSLGKIETLQSKTNRIGGFLDMANATFITANEHNHFLTQSFAIVGGFCYFAAFGSKARSKVRNIPSLHFN
jgi:hypothetical protein